MDEEARAEIADLKRNLQYAQSDIRTLILSLDTLRSTEARHESRTQQAEDTIRKLGLSVTDLDTRVSLIKQHHGARLQALEMVAR